MRRVLPAGPFPEEKERSRYGRGGEYTCSRIRRHSVMYSKLAVPSKNGLDGGDYERIIVVIRLDPPEEDVAIDEVRRPCHLAGPHI
jgi:hypothetical protein